MLLKKLEGGMFMKQFSKKVLSFVLAFVMVASLIAPALPSFKVSATGDEQVQSQENQNGGDPLFP